MRRARLIAHLLELSSFLPAGAVILTTAVVVATGFCLSAYASDLVRNGLLSEGTGGQPSGWRHEAYYTAPDSAGFQWTTGSTGIGMLVIHNPKQNDTWWIQTFPVSPSTWYRVSGWIRAENVGTKAMGANLSELETGYRSGDLRGTQDWQLVEFWMKTRANQTVARLACRIGGISSLNTGTAYFTGISYALAEGPPDGELVWGGSAWDFRGQREILFGSAIISVCMIFLLWRYIDSVALPRSRSVAKSAGGSEVGRSDLSSCD
jgi:hypothetical protein